MNRRAFLKSSLILASGAAVGCHTVPRRVSVNEKLNIGMIGTANQAAYDLSNVSSENIVALCDVDDKLLDAALVKHPGAKRYNDFRRLLEQKDIDAVVIAIPDHSHAVAAVAALESGRDVYCEKPLARTISEARIIAETARRNKRITQIGTQIHAGNNYRRVVELVKSDAIGQVREVHVWVAATYGGKKLPTDKPPIPPGLNYDLWIGPAHYRPYSPEYVPFKWRNWWEFGGGALADFGCHYMDLPHWALDLRAPVSAEAEGPEVDPECPPPWMIVHYEYPARDAAPPVKLTWYHGGKKPPFLTKDQAAKWGSGVLFIGSKGSLISDYSKHQLLPEAKFAGFVAPAPFIPNSIGHHKEWIQACKTRGTTTCNFDYSGPLTEAALLGNVAFRAGCKVNWDTRKMKALNCPAADEYIHHHYRKGWSI
ncbi:MAG: putative NADH-dependent dehydrogenase [Verrucomicrobiales bacterium]|nr:putative NADH-dependent dehydrogenase [Verrucomicrobiales bacterium]